MTDRRNQHIFDFCENDFPRWVATRGRYIDNRYRTVFEQFMPSPTAIERDYKNDAYASEFNLALQLKLNMKPEQAMSFMYVYFKKQKPKTLKAYVHYDLEDKVSIQTVIEWAHKIAEEIHSLATANVALNDFRREQTLKKIA